MRGQVPLKRRRRLLKWWTDALTSIAVGARFSHPEQSGFAKLDGLDLSTGGERKKLVSKACFDGGSALDFGQRRNGLVQRAS